MFEALDFSPWKRTLSSLGEATIPGTRLRRVGAVRNAAFLDLRPAISLPVRDPAKGRELDHCFGAVGEGILRRAKPIDPVFPALEIGAGHAFRQPAGNDDDLVLHIDTRVGIYILGLDHPARTGVNDIARTAPGCENRKKIVAKREVLAIQIEPRVRGIDLRAPDRKFLKISAVVARGFESPGTKMVGYVHRGDIEPARGRIAAFELIGSNKRQPFPHLLGRNTVGVAELWRGRSCGGFAALR